MCAVAHLQCSATLIFAKYSSPLLGTAVQDRLAKYSRQQACVAAETPMETCSKYMCAVAHLQCSATLTFAKYISPLFSIAQQYRLIAGLCCCRNT